MISRLAQIVDPVMKRENEIFPIQFYDDSANTD
jgi:hypothetical protein